MLAKLKRLVERAKDPESDALLMTYCLTPFYGAFAVAAVGTIGVPIAMAAIAVWVLHEEDKAKRSEEDAET